jgi:hypothetical protein
MNIIKRGDAKALKLKRYFTGKPCGNGHLSERTVNNGTCIECAKLTRLKYESKYPGMKSKKAKEYYENNAEACRKRASEFRKENPDYIKTYRDTYYKENKKYFILAAIERNKDLKLRTPPWSNLEEIRKIYEKCMEISSSTGIPYNVDHIIPLRGKEVCGLHTINNLRIIPKIDNQRKTNKFIPELL